ncbi:MAG: magnesium/cobalt transporter CorA [Nitrospirota bacterium]
MITVITYSKENGYRLLEKTALSHRVSDEKHDLIWIDFESASPEEATLLSSYFDFHPLAIEDCIAETPLPKVDDFGDYVFLVLHGSQLKTENQFITNEINFFLGRNYLATYHETFSRSIQEARERCLKNMPSVARGADFLLHEILDRLVDNYFPVLERFHEEMEQIEQEVFSNPKKNTLNKIVMLKKEVTAIYRTILPQQEILNRLSRDSFSVISNKATVYYRDVYDHLARISELADSYRDQLGGTLEAYLTVVSNRLNEVMKVLTMFTATLMPLTLITGIYGMNFENMPEIKTRFGYFVVLGVMAVTTACIVFYFRKKKWL